MSSPLINPLTEHCHNLLYSYTRKYDDKIFEIETQLRTETDDEVSKQLLLKFKELVLDKINYQITQETTNGSYDSPVKKNQACLDQIKTVHDQLLQIPRDKVTKDLVKFKNQITSFFNMRFEGAAGGDFFYIHSSKLAKERKYNKKDLFQFFDTELKKLQETIDRKTQVLKAKEDIEARKIAHENATPIIEATAAVSTLGLTFVYCQKSYLQNNSVRKINYFDARSECLSMLNASAHKKFEVLVVSPSLPESIVHYKYPLFTSAVVALYLYVIASLLSTEGNSAPIAACQLLGSMVAIMTLFTANINYAKAGNKQKLNNIDYIEFNSYETNPPTAHRNKAIYQIICHQAHALLKKDPNNDIFVCNGINEQGKRQWFITACPKGFKVKKASKEVQKIETSHVKQQESAFVLVDDSDLQQIANQYEQNCLVEQTKVKDIEKQKELKEKEKQKQKRKGRKITDSSNTARQKISVKTAEACLGKQEISQKESYTPQIFINEGRGLDLFKDFDLPQKTYNFLRETLKSSAYALADVRNKNKFTSYEFHGIKIYENHLEYNGVILRAYYYKDENKVYALLIGNKDTQEQGIGDFRRAVDIVLKEVVTG